VATQLLDLVESQMIANRLPLVAVSLAAVPHANTPTVLTLHWHGFVEVKLAEQGNAIAYQSVPSSALQLNMRWDRFDDIEFDALDMTAFGVSPLEIDGEPPFVADVADGDDLIEMAGREGYVQWMFRPVRGGMWSEVADDETLEAGGYRNPTCPLTTQPVLETYRLRTPRRVVYPFGRSRKILQ